MFPRGRPDVWRLLLALGSVAVVTLVYVRWLGVSNAATVSITFLLVVLVVAATSPLWIAVATSVAAMLAFNFFFLPPVGAWTIADPQNWVALVAFLLVSLIASNLSAVARARAEEALDRRNELTRLFDLGRDVLVMTDGPDALSILARSVARRYDLAFVGIAVPRDGDWEVSQAGALPLVLDRAQLSAALAAAQASLEFDAHSRTYAGHQTLMVEGRSISLVPLRVGTKPIGLLAAESGRIEAGTFDALGGVVAIAIERAQLLEERKAAEVTKRNEELKSALLASLGHDLRTPLTAIRVAATNIASPSLSPGDLAEQRDVLLDEAERLTRLFQNILEMARIDADAVPTESRWVHPSEIVAAAREQVEQALRRHVVEVQIDPDVPVRLDPRLTATALAHLLENAARYARPGSTIHVHARVTADGLSLDVRDHGPGIAPADIPRLFDRFYRGSASSGHGSGSGLGLSIARGLLAVERGRLWAENASDGGARFSLSVPAATRSDVTLSA